MAQRNQFEFNLLRAMEVFVAVVETRQVTRAASMLGMTQSAASQHLRSLERAFSTELLDRSSRPLGLTRTGVALHRRAARIINEIEHLQADLRRADAAPTPVLRVGMLPSIATTLTAPLVDLLRDRRGVEEVAIFASLAGDLQDLLRARRTDLLVTSDALYDVDGLERHTLFREAFLLVTPQSYTGPRDDPARVAEHLPLVHFAAGTPAGRLTNQHLRRIRLDPKRAVEGDRSSILCAAVAQGTGFALLTPTLLLDGLAEGLAVDAHPLKPHGFSRTLTLVAREEDLGTLPAETAAEIGHVLKRRIGELLGETGRGALL